MRKTCECSIFFLAHNPADLMSSHQNNAVGLILTLNIKTMIDYSQIMRSILLVVPKSVNLISMLEFGSGPLPNTSFSIPFDAEKLASILG